MADDYRNLGNFHINRGEFDRAEAMYLKSMKLFQKIRHIVQMSEVEDLLDGLGKRRDSIRLNPADISSTPDGSD